MKFAKLAQVLEELEKINSRNLMTEVIADYLTAVGKEEIKQAVYLLLGELGPLYARVDFGLADKMVARAIAKTVEMEVGEIMAVFKQTGDWGEVVEKLKVQSSNVKMQNAALTIEEVYERLLHIAQASGEGSQEAKIEKLAALLRQTTSIEAKFIVRTVLGKMRLGFSDKTILDAVAVMDGGGVERKKRLEQVYQLLPDIGEIGRLVKQYGSNELKNHVAIQVGVPIMPALAQRLRSADEMIGKMKKVVVEPKFDGQRVQIHFQKGVIVKAFARSLEENTSMFPELERIGDQIKADSVILDCEAVGYDPETGGMKPFQETITRKRKYGVEEVSKLVPVRFNCFDILLLNGESLLMKPLYQRRKILAEVIESGEVLRVDDYIVTENAEELRQYHQRQLDLGFEGAMVKQYDGVYQPGRTGWNWVKFKEVETAVGKLSDTIDGVVMGYYRGRGKRSALGIGAFLLGIWDEEKQVYVTVAKIGTGLTDEQWREMKRRVDMIFTETRPKEYVVAAGLVPDVWAEPKVVVEIAADEVTASPVHSSGWGLRFPRLVRFRDDKRVEQITTVEEIKSLRES